MSYSFTPYQASSQWNSEAASPDPSYYYDVNTLSWSPTSALPTTHANSIWPEQETNWAEVEASFLSNSGRHASSSSAATFSTYAIPLSPQTPISPTQSTSSQSPLPIPRRHDSSDFTLKASQPINDKKEKRRLQNRDSQRAYRERTRKKEEEMTGIIAKLQGEIDTLRKQEKSSSQIIEALSAEVERLRAMGLIFEWNGI